MDLNENKDAVESPAQTDNQMQEKYNENEIETSTTNVITEEEVSDDGVVKKSPSQQTLGVDIPATQSLLDDLNKDASKLADSISHLSGGLTVNLHALQHICSQYITVHETAVADVGQAVDRSVSAMSSLMIGCEQISENMPPVEQLMEQLTKVKETLDILESTVGPDL